MKFSTAAGARQASALRKTGLDVLRPRAAKQAPGQGGKLAVLGLGYVGLPTAVAFANAGHRVVGFDTDAARIRELRRGLDRTLEVPAAELARAPVAYTQASEHLRGVKTFIVAVPTPLTPDRRPDLGPLLAASRSIGAALSPGSMVVYESTVYPGATETQCVPVLEAVSGLVAGRDFDVAYSPERTNPGDPGHQFSTVRKVVAAISPAGLERVTRLYSAVIAQGVHQAPSIRVAEAAKVVENAQRDVNIAFVNELACILDRMGLDTEDVLRAASTKWNFVPFSPGLVGGHCIGVDTQYLAYVSELSGHHPEVLLAGRRVNGAMASFVARRCIRMLMASAAARRVTLLGVTFKEGTPDLRNSPAVEIVRELRAHGVEVQLVDPLADADAVRQATGIGLTPLEAIQPSGAVILAVAHAPFVRGGWSLMRRCAPAGGFVLDVKRVLDRDRVPDDITLWRL